jgi:hypothetical protein
MKYLILLPALFLLLFTALSAEDWYGINLPEELNYKISYFSIVAGYGSIKAESTEFEGRKAVKITGKVWSSKFFSTFYKLDDTIISIIDAKTLEPLWHSVDYHEGKYRRKAVFVFDYQKGECTSRDGIVKISEGLLEPLGAFFYLRINELKKGIPIKKEVFDGLTVKEATIVVINEERIKTRFGPKQTIIISPVMKDFRKAGITQVQENISIYLQKELPRLPYLAKGKLVIGSLKATLTEINHYEADDRLP